MEQSGGRAATAAIDERLALEKKWRFDVWAFDGAGTFEPPELAGRKDPLFFCLFTGMVSSA